MSSSYASICVLCINNQVFDAELSRKKITHNNRLQRYEKKMTYANFFYKKKDTCCFGGALLVMGDWLWVIGYGILAIGNGLWAMGDFFANNFRFICVCQRFILILQKIV
jgi:hypothetical protein